MALQQFEENPRGPLFRPSNLKRVYNRSKAKGEPNNPTELFFDIDGGEKFPANFLRKDIRVGNSARHLLFLREEQIALLKPCKRWYLDGTFRLIKEPFQHLFSINGWE